MHRVDVDVVAHFGRDGSIVPVCVQWLDGRSFPVDEVLEAAPFSGPLRGRRSARYRVRFGRHETELYLELRPACPEASAAEELVWWVLARDTVKPGRKAPSSPSSPKGVGK